LLKYSNNLKTQFDKLNSKIIEIEKLRNKEIEEILKKTGDEKEKLEKELNN
jgi:hypothetical protein